MSRCVWWCSRARWKECSVQVSSKFSANYSQKKWWLLGLCADQIMQKSSWQWVLKEIKINLSKGHRGASSSLLQPKCPYSNAAQMSILQLPWTLLNWNAVSQDSLNGLSSERDRREHFRCLFLGSNIFLLYLGADLKERAKMDDAEVGEFVRRLRNLMDEIGKGLYQLENLSWTTCSETFRNAVEEDNQQVIQLGAPFQKASVYAWWKDPIRIKSQASCCHSKDKMHFLSTTKHIHTYVINTCSEKAFIYSTLLWNPWEAVLCWLSHFQCMLRNTHNMGGT